MRKTRAKRKSSRAPASIPAVEPDEPRPQPAAVQDAATKAIKTATAPPPPMSPIASPAEQVGVEQRSGTLPAVAVFLGAAISASMIAFVVVALLGSAKAGRSSRDASSFCCVNEALMVLSVVNSSVSPCEDFYAHVCSSVDAGSMNHLSPAFRVATNRRLLESSALGSERTAAGRLLDSLNDRFLSDDTPFDKDVADFATAILDTGLADRRMNSSRMARFFAELSLRYGLPSVISFSVRKAGTSLAIERNDDCFAGDGYQSILARGLQALDKALNVSVTVNQLEQMATNLTKRPSANTTGTISHGLHEPPFTSLLESEWASIMNDLILPVFPNLTAVVMQKEDRINELFSALIDQSSQHLAVVYAIMCTAMTTRDRIDEDAPGQMTDVPCQVLQVCELEDRIVTDTVRSVRMDSQIQSVFSKTRADVIQRAKGHPIFESTSEQELSNEMSKLRLVLPQEIVVWDVPIPTVSKTFATNLLKARSYIYDVRRAKVAREIPSTNTLFFPSLFRHDDVIYFPTNLYVLLNQGPNATGPLDIAAFGVKMAAQMWTFLLERAWPPRTRESINARLQCFGRKRANESTGGDDPVKTATAALAMLTAVDDAVEPQWNAINIVNNTKISVVQLVYLISRRDPAALAALTTPGRMNHARGCGFPDTGSPEQVWRLEEREALAVPKAGASVHEPRSSMRVRSTSGLFRLSSTSH
ncbi:hypothetical protein HPB52_002195 [Rhipicephalus sanguineus]|uniref:Uncharacterized protein n=1 Tax=Rhipicephalus sanguineus TaxID=34632 RepID=A0A9D4PF26_RHISA|nr:hypothetical protein HPB52_002195 [Rhipicephalus sanguineus]